MFHTVITSAEFWMAVLALFQTILLSYFNVPQDIWSAVNAIILVLIGSLTVDRLSKSVVRGIRGVMYEMRNMPQPKED